MFNILLDRIKIFVNDAGGTRENLHIASPVPFAELVPGAKPPDWAIPRKD